MQRLLWEAGAKILLLGLLIEHAVLVFSRQEIVDLENVQGARRMLRDEYYRVFLILFTAEYYIWERMRTVNR